MIYKGMERCICELFVKEGKVFLLVTPFQPQFMELAVKLGCVGPELQFPWKQKFNCKNQKQTDTGSRQNLYNKIQEGSEL